MRGGGGRDERCVRELMELWENNSLLQGYGKEGRSR